MLSAYHLIAAVATQALFHLFLVLIVVKAFKISLGSKYTVSQSFGAFQAAKKVATGGHNEARGHLSVIP